jgi:hypothetical protein
MKFITITGGLGNQMFIYAFCEELRARGYNSTLFIQHRYNLRKYGHQGYELEKLFSIETNTKIFIKLLNSILVLFSQVLRAFPIMLREKMYNLIGLHIKMVPENFIFYPEVFNFDFKNQLFRGTWQSEKYFSNVKEIIKIRFKFKEELISKKTKDLAVIICQANSVSIHIRRGDYLSDQYINGFAGICTLDYYKKAVDYINSNTKGAVFYVFTDDFEWVTENFVIPNATFIQHNTGNNSWQDMYLMSLCKHNIIANSSFSWWGAWLNSNPHKIVIAPKKWWRLFEKDDVVPNEWIRL